jgi:hypothetical protein
VAEYDLRSYLATQAQETYRACIIHAPPMRGKTRLANQMRDALGVYLLDLQTHFIGDEQLAARVDRYRPKDLEALLLGLAVTESVVVVDNMDFLLNTWTPAQRREFIGMVEHRLKSPGVTDKVFVFMVQSEPNLAGHEMRNTRGQSRIAPLEAFYAL